MASRNLEKLIAEEAEVIAEQMNQVASFARSEEDVRHECNKLIDEFLKKAGVRVRAWHEYGLAGGRIDSKYGGVIIEYKYPKGSGKITENPKAPGTVAVIKQVKKRFDDFLAEEKIERDHLFGVGCDGDTLVFVRFRGGKWDIDAPKPVTRYTVERFLRALISLGAQGRSFSPENLVGDFGADSPAAQKGIHTLYETICETKSKKAQTFFKQWKILFGEVCGYDVEGRNEKINKLGEHYMVPNARPAELLFAVHSYYAIFMKFLAAEIVSSFSPLGVSVVKACVGAANPAKLRREMEELEQGGIWAQLKITNFLEGDLFRWYLDAWNKEVADLVREIATRLDTYDPSTLSVEPAESRDLLKKLYQNLFPKSVRHDLGEYYTPDWLAEHVLNELGYEGDPDKRLLDPACGSGTFLVMAINRAKRWFNEHRHECGYGEDELVQRVLRNIIGFDLNPLAVMASRTNYLIVIRDLIQYAAEVEIPVYLCDSIMTPSEYGVVAGGQYDILSPDGEEVIQVGKAKELKTAADKFLIPAEIASSRELMGKYADALEFCVRNKYSTDDFMSRCGEEDLPVAEQQLHTELYTKLRKLDAENQNGIWARIMKNAFAPLFIGRVDYVAGNPPWINWESLPEDYRQSTAPLWQEYDLFRHKGYKAKLGAGKDDISILMTYVAHDCYLSEGGLLGFVITQSVFKTKGGGEGFRTFQYSRGGRKYYLPVICAHDMSGFQPFEGATNRTAVVIVGKSSKSFKYPVPYVIWGKHGKGSITQDSSLAEVIANTRRRELAAEPVDKAKPTSPWLTASKAALPAIRRVIGKSDYTAYAGCCTWLNGVYWARVLEELQDGNLLIENLYDIGKKKVEHIKRVIEPDLVYPLLRGRDVSRWHAEPSAYIILANRTDRLAGIPENEMKRRYPKTFAYFREFEAHLRNRSGYGQYFKATDPFYSIYNVGPYTVAPWKVVWPWIASGMRCAVIGGEGLHSGIPEHNASFAAFKDPDEAHYFCAMLASAPSDLAIRAFSSGGGGGLASPQVLGHVAIAKYDQHAGAHKHLSKLSQRCHAAAAGGGTEAVAGLETEIDEAAAGLWGITDDELKAIQKALKEMEGTKEKSRKKRRAEDDK